MDKEFCTYEQALALKELGFDEPCLGYYVNVEVPNPFLVITKISDTQGGYFTFAPLYQQAFRWFREKYELHSYIHADYSWNISGGIWDLNGYKGSRYDWDSEAYLSYEEAEQACLDRLIEIVKTNDIK